MNSKAHTQRNSTVCLLIAVLCFVPAGIADEPAPHAIRINHDPQFFIDDYLVDNRWANDYLNETITRVFHPPQKEERNPVIAGSGGYVNVVRDEEAGVFRMWYQDFWDQSLKPRKYTYGVAYAESKNGMNWVLPKLRKYKFKDTLNNNIVLMGPGGARAETQFVLDLPPEHRRGYKYVMLYSTDAKGRRGLHLIGSQNGIDWDANSDTVITPGFTPDTHSNIIWDSGRQKFVCFTRATNIYQKKGQRRKVARMDHTALWEPWPVVPENIMLPDVLDAQTNHNYFYGMPTKYHAGIYWGFLWPYEHQNDIFAELAFSRDGRHFRRLPNRPRLLDVGPSGTWDDGMVAVSDWLTVGDEWWMYYSGTNGAHSSHTLTPGIGLARVRRDGFVSLHSPQSGGHIVTRLIHWPGGKLYVNANATDGEFTVKVTGYDRQPLRGFSRQFSQTITGDDLRHEVTWSDGDMKALAGKRIRLEFSMNGNVDLYTFQAVGPKAEGKTGS